MPLLIMRLCRMAWYVRSRNLGRLIWTWTDIKFFPELRKHAVTAVLLAERFDLIRGPGNDFVCISFWLYFMLVRLHSYINIAPHVFVYFSWSCFNSDERLGFPEHQFLLLDIFVLGNSIKVYHSKSLTSNVFQHNCFCTIAFCEYIM